MWLAAQFAGGRLLRTELAGMPAGANVTAYAANGLVAVFNKDTSPMLLEVRGTKPRGQVFRLTGPALESKTGVVLGTGSREPGTEWTLGPDGPASLKPLLVPAASALLVRLG